MAGKLRLPNLGPRSRKALLIVGYVFLGLVTFVFALQRAFPYDRVKTKIEEALGEKYQVTIGDVERGWIPGRVFFNSITLRTRPGASGSTSTGTTGGSGSAKPDGAAATSEDVTTVFINRLEVDVHFLPLLSGAASASLDAAIGPGHIRGTARISKGGTTVSFEGENLQSQMLPMREAIGLPMSGMVEFEVDLDLPNDKLKSGRAAPNWQKAEGSARLACPTGCTFGDGKTKLKTKLKNQRNQAFAADGIEFGKVNLKSMLAKVEIKTGQLKITQFDTSSDDGTLYVDYMMELEPVFADSLVTGCLRFNVSQALLQREPKTFSAITATGAPLGPDNLFHIKLADKFKDMKRLPQVCGSAVSSKSMDNPGARPTLTVPTEEPAKVIDAGIPTPPTITPPPTPEAAAGATPGSAVTVPVPGPDHPGSAAAGSGSAEPTPPPASGEVR